MARLNQQKAGVLLSYLNLALGSIIPLFYTPVMLDILGKAEYGLYSLSASVISYLSLLNLGMGSAIVRYVAKYRAEQDTQGVRRLMGLFVLFYGAMSLLVCIAGGGISIFTDKLFANGLTAGEIDRLEILVLIMTLSMAVSLPVSAFASAISAYERFVFIRVVGICETVAIPCLNLVLIYLGRGSIGMALVGLTMQVVSAVLYVAYCSKKLKIAPVFRKMPWHLLKEIAGYCFFVFLTTIVDMLYWSTDKVLIGATLGTVAVAIYNVGGVFTSIMQNLSQSISQVFTPRVMMIATAKEKSHQEVSDMMLRVGRLQFYIVSFVLTGYIVFGRVFIKIWADEGYDDAYYIALLTMLPLAIPLIQSIAYSSMLAQNKHRFRAIVFLIIAIINVISTYLVLPYYGIIGAAVCTAVAFLLGTGIVMNIYYHRVMQLDIPAFWKGILRITVAPAALAAVSAFVYNRYLASDKIGIFLICVVVYSVIFWLITWFTSMNRYEKDMFLGMIKRK